MKISIVGAGIFGCICAIKLRHKFPHAEIVIFDRNYGICQEASRINQYRLHEGYHYPRSPETVQQCQSGIDSFEREYGDCFSPPATHYYCIAKNGSEITPEEFLRFLESSKLPYQVANRSLFLNQDSINLSVRVAENSIDIKKLTFKLSQQLKENKIITVFNARFDKEDIDDYDLVINCTYSNLNHLLDLDEQIDYQFELCEKPVIELGHDYRYTSCVIMDGPFMCIDPIGETRKHVMGHVVHAIHHTNIGKFPEIPLSYKWVLNSGLIIEKDLEILTNFSKFVKHGKEFFNNFDPIHIGSMFTIRTVLPDREYDDGRPSYITKHSDKLYSVFSGKFVTAVDIANELITRL